MFNRKSRLRPGKISISCAKRVLQHYPRKTGSECYAVRTTLLTRSRRGPEEQLRGTENQKSSVSQAASFVSWVLMR